MGALVLCAGALVVWALIRSAVKCQIGDGALDVLVGLGVLAAALADAPGHAVWVLMAGILCLWLDAWRGPPAA